MSEVPLWCTFSVWCSAVMLHRVYPRSFTDILDTRGTLYEDPHTSAIVWTMCATFFRPGFTQIVQPNYKGTSLTRNIPPVGPYSSPMPTDLW